MKKENLGLILVSDQKLILSTIGEMQHSIRTISGNELVKSTKLNLMCLLIISVQMTYIKGILEIATFSLSCLQQLKFQKELN